MKILKFGFLLSVISLVLMSCRTTAQNTSIKSVTFRQTFGRGGATFISADKDSIESSAIGGRNTEIPAFKKKIIAKDWQKVVSGINISTLDKIKSGERRGHYDGPDKIFIIKTSKKEYEFYNVPEDSEGYGQLKKLRNNLENLLIKYK